MQMIFELSKQCSYEKRVSQSQRTDIDIGIFISSTDSVFEHYKNPDKFCWTPWISTGIDALKDDDVTLEALRSR